MIALKIIQIGQYDSLKLVDKNNKVYSLVISPINFAFCKNDIIFINQKLLDRTNDWFSQPYFFEYVNQKFVDNGEFISVLRDKSQFVLKRVYG